MNCIADVPSGVFATTLRDAFLPGEYVGTEGKSSAARAVPAPTRSAAIAMIDFIVFIVKRSAYYDFPVIDEIYTGIVDGQSVGSAIDSDTSAYAGHISKRDNCF